MICNARRQKLDKVRSDVNESGSQGLDFFSSSRFNRSAGNSFSVTFCCSGIKNKTPLVTSASAVTKGFYFDNSKKLRTRGCAAARIF